jgi:predicted O-linked N-acetylglucosamine transferase (SPINDLY family)
VQRALALLSAQRFAEAEPLLRAAMTRDPRDGHAKHALAKLLLDTARSDQALYLLDQMQAQFPGAAPVLYERSRALAACNRKSEAIAQLQELVRREPVSVQPRLALAGMLLRASRCQEALATLDTAETYVRTPGERANVLGGRANCYAELGLFDQAIATQRQLLDLVQVDHRTLATLAFFLNFSDTVTRADILHVHTRIGAMVLREQVATPALVNPRDPHKRLKIGFLGPDFREHSVSYFLEPLLRSLSREDFQVFGYGSLPKPDHVTKRLASLCDTYRDIYATNHTDCAQRIRDDGIDILIELAGISRGTRVWTLPSRAAPVQITYCGYPNTTGLPGVDVRLVDAITDPPEADQWHTEKLVRLPGCFLCYQPPLDAPEPKVPAADIPFTFGSFNALQKLSPLTVEVWSEVLRNLPQAKLLLKGKPFAEREIREHHLARFAERGIDPSRVELLTRTDSVAEHLNLYSRMHVALDTFPYNGTTTTCEALWMGVPVVTMRCAGEQDRHASRVSRSLLHAVGCAELATDSRQAFVELCVELATNPKHVPIYRQTLRQRMQASPLCDQKAFAGTFGDSLRQLWHQWCTSGN